MKAAIEIQNLGKQYRRREQSGKRYKTLRDSLMSAWWKKTKEQKDDFFWALRHLDVSINPGEIMGVIGANGAGKSTLLKLLTRVTAPTEGSFTLRGRVASLLEVGTGFHPELTGRENIFLSGTIMGMQRAEIKRKFDEIVAFAGVEQFLDLPVKRYSSGMYVRLGFAVAAHLEAEILLVDEVLAVGDAAFQKKCLGKMDDVAQSGRTVLFVSHNLGAVRQLCTRSMLVNQGMLKKIGETEEVLETYQETIQNKIPSKIPERKKGVKEVEIRNVFINGISVNRGIPYIDAQEKLIIETEIYIDDTRPLQINIGFYKEGIRLFTLQDVAEPTANKKQDNIIASRFVLPANLFKKGTYTMGIGGNINGVKGDWFWSYNYCLVEVEESDFSVENQLNFGVVKVKTINQRFS